mgnify:CR=1 FL=1
MTVLHQTQEQLRLAVRDREHILAVVAHDLRTPLKDRRNFEEEVVPWPASPRRTSATAST